MVDTFCVACGTSVDRWNLDAHMCSTTTKHPWEVKGWAGLNPATAIIDPQGVYRYRLTRDLLPDNERTMTFIMLNPSTATHEEDDPTIRRCMGFAERNGYGRLEVINLFSFRATSPKRLVSMAKEDPSWLRPDPVDRMVRHVAATRPESRLVAAWGKRPSGMPKDIYEAAVERMASMASTEFGVSLYCLGVNLDGSPKHPLYVKGDKLLEPWPLAPLPN